MYPVRPFKKITSMRMTDKSTENVTSSSSNASKKKTDNPNESSKDRVHFIRETLNFQRSKIEIYQNI
jgi:hypothetical protein